MGKIEIVCPHCGARYGVDAAAAGRKARCTSCQTLFRLPPPGEKRVVIQGTWMNSFWAEKAVSIPREISVERFLAAKPLPILWPEDRAYVQHLNKDSPEAGALHWIVVLLHHPEPTVVLQVLEHWARHHLEYVESPVRMPYQSLFFDSVADHLVSPVPKLARAACEFCWLAWSPGNFEKLLEILRDPRFSDRDRAVQALSDTCSAAHRDEFRQLLSRFDLHGPEPLPEYERDGRKLGISVFEMTMNLLGAHSSGRANPYKAGYYYSSKKWLRSCDDVLSGWHLPGGPYTAEHVHGPFSYEKDAVADAFRIA